MRDIPRLLFLRKAGSALKGIEPSPFEIGEIDHQTASISSRDTLEHNSDASISSVPAQIDIVAGCPTSPGKDSRTQSKHDASSSAMEDNESIGCLGAGMPRPSYEAQISSLRNRQNPLRILKKWGAVAALRVIYHNLYELRPHLANEMEDDQYEEIVNEWMECLEENMLVFKEKQKGIQSSQMKRHHDMMSRPIMEEEEDREAGASPIPSVAWSNFEYQNEYASAASISHLQDDPWNCDQDITLWLQENDDVAASPCHEPVRWADLEDEDDSLPDISDWAKPSPIDIPRINTNVARSAEPSPTSSHFRDSSLDPDEDDYVMQLNFSPPLTPALSESNSLSPFPSPILEGPDLAICGDIPLLSFSQSRSCKCSEEEDKNDTLSKPPPRIFGNLAAQLGTSSC